MADLKNKKLDEKVLGSVSGGVDPCEDGALYPDGTLVNWKKRVWTVTGHYWGIGGPEAEWMWLYNLVEYDGGQGLTANGVEENVLVLHTVPNPCY